MPTALIIGIGIVIGVIAVIVGLELWSMMKG